MSKYTPKKLRGKQIIQVDNQIIRWRKKRKEQQKELSALHIPDVKFFGSPIEHKEIELKGKSYNFFEDETLDE